MKRRGFLKFLGIALIAPALPALTADAQPRPFGIAYDQIEWAYDVRQDCWQCRMAARNQANGETLVVFLQSGDRSPELDRNCEEMCRERLRYEMRRRWAKQMADDAVLV